jgi:hypothetical protein
LFAHVYFVKGSPLYELDLLRAGVMQAGASLKSYITTETQILLQVCVCLGLGFKDWACPFPLWIVRSGYRMSDDVIIL